jgi:hypothetical protein
MDLFVEDGWIASGTVGALAAVALLEIGPTAGSPLAELGGPVLFLLLMALLLANLYTAGRRASESGR